MTQQFNFKDFRRTLYSTRITVLFALVANACMNILLLSYLFRLGGIELVGQWSVLVAAAMIVLILDFGVTNALTYLIAHKGVFAALPAFRRLRLLAGGAISLGILATATLWILEQPFGVGISLAFVSALLSLLSNWLVSIRVAQNDLLWFSLKTVVRVLIQTTVVVALVGPDLEAAWLVLGLALLTGGTMEFLLIYVLLRHQIQWKGSKASMKELQELTAGFGLVNATQIALQPLSQFILAQYLGLAAVGIFTIGLRIPNVINEASSGALRTLLPAISGLIAVDRRENAIALLRDSLVTQIMFTVPLVIFTIIHAAALLQIWLGAIDPKLLVALRIFGMAAMLVAVGTPFYWAAMAFGQSKAIARISVLRLVLVTAVGWLVLRVNGEVLHFITVFALGQAGNALAVILLTGGRDCIVSDVAAAIRWNRVALAVTMFLGFNFGLAVATEDLPAWKALALVVSANFITCGPLAFFTARRRLLTRAEIRTS